MGRKKKTVSSESSVAGQLTVEMKPTGAPIKLFRIRANAVFSASDVEEATRKVGKHIQAMGTVGVEAPQFFEEGSVTIEPCRQRKLHIVQDDKSST